MINPYAETFMIAARTRGVAHWEQPSFANKRDRDAAPRLIPSRSRKPGGWVRLFRRRTGSDDVSL